MSINKLIKECANRNFAKASKLFESELEKSILELLSDEKEDLLDLKEFDEEEVTESEKEEVLPESDDDKEVMESEEEELLPESEESDDEPVLPTEESSDDVFDSVLSSGDHLEEDEHQDKFKALLSDYGVESLEELTDDQKAEFFTKLKESEESDDLEDDESDDESDDEEFENDFEIEDDFEDMVENKVFGRK